MPDTRQETRGFVLTDAGMLALWDPTWFSDIIDYDTWELRVLDPEEMTGHVGSGALVPIGVGDQGGGWSVLVRTGTVENPADLTGREARHTYVSAGPYLFISTGELRLSGVESIGADLLDRVLAAPLSTGRHMVRIHRIDWAAEPESRKDSGEPMPHALSDFVVLIDPEHGRPDYRVCGETFGPPPVS